MAAILKSTGQTLQVNGDIAVDDADACCDEGLALLAQMTGDVVVDLAGVMSASSLTVAVLLRWARRVAAAGGTLRLANVPEKCRAIVQVSGLAGALPEIK
ncbi:MAG: STAS domain-containing protein [bacterium]|nr:STAS domain-containing protein [bacterium]